jgi:predicted nucleotidyltransferase
VLKSNTPLIAAIGVVFQAHPEIQLAVLFGSVAAGKHRRDSDIDVAVDIGRPLTAVEKMEFVAQFAEKTGHPVDVVDLHRVGEPLLGKILANGVRMVGSKARYGDLIRKHLFDAADFMPYRSRILRERRREWTAK